MKIRYALAALLAMGMLAGCSDPELPTGEESASSGASSSQAQSSASQPELLEEVSREPVDDFETAVQQLGYRPKMIQQLPGEDQNAWSVEYAILNGDILEATYTDGTRTFVYRVQKSDTETPLSGMHIRNNELYLSGFEGDGYIQTLGRDDLGYLAEWYSKGYNYSLYCEEGFTLEECDIIYPSIAGDTSGGADAEAAGESDTAGASAAAGESETAGASDAA